MFQLVGVLIASLFVVLIIDVPRIALLTGFTALALGALAVYLYHRRKLAELRELHVDRGHGQFSPMQRGLRWPKRCDYCRQVMHSWRDTSAHLDPKVSGCAALRAAAERAELADETAAREAPHWTATVVGKGGEAAIDTMLDEPEQIDS